MGWEVGVILREGGVAGVGSVVVVEEGAEVAMSEQLWGSLSEVDALFGSRTTWIGELQPRINPSAMRPRVSAFDGSMMDTRNNMRFIVEGDKCIDRTRRLWRSKSIKAFIWYSETCNTVLEQVNDMDIRMRTTDLWHSEA